MPLTVEAAFTKLVSKFMWGDAAASPPISIKTLYDHPANGGLSLLDLKARNDAIEIMWVKDYLNMSSTRPKWSYVVDVILAHTVTANSRRLDMPARVNAFLQTWKVSVAPAALLPVYLRTMVKVANKHGV
ncbi:hypothetical protein C8T65DRAFT_593230, partial [Cerioporus squamosus]